MSNTEPEGVSGEAVYLKAAEQAAYLASLIFNSSVFGSTGTDLTHDYHAWLEIMNAPGLDDQTKRSVWEHYGKVFADNSMSCSPAYQIQSTTLASF